MRWKEYISIILKNKQKQEEKKTRLVTSQIDQSFANRKEKKTRLVRLQVSNHNQTWLENAKSKLKLVMPMGQGGSKFAYSHSHLYP